MISLLPITPGELWPLIHLAFKDDDLLLSTYHISPGELDHCVADTFDAIDQYRMAQNTTESEGVVKMYKVVIIEDGVTVEIGYTVVLLKEGSPDNLLSFGIGSKYRFPEILKKWMSELSNLLHLPYYTRLWNKNTRAIDFFVKNGFIMKEENGYKMLIKYE